jgi:hypothetical protein
VLAMSRGLGTFARRGVVATKKMEEIRLLKQARWPRLRRPGP